MARGTARSALTALVDEALIEVVPGRGRRIADEPAAGTSSSLAYRRIADDLVRRVQAGDFSGIPMPSEAALVNEYGVARSTARRAYRVLVENGVVEIRQGAADSRQSTMGQHSFHSLRVISL